MERADLIEKFFNSMFRLRKLASQKTFEKSEDKATMLQFWALNFLNEQRSVTVSELGQFLHLSKSSVAQLSDRLVKMGFVNREPDKKDRRVTHLLLSKNGKESLRDHQKKIFNKMARIFAGIPKKDMKEIIRINTKLAQALESYVED